METATADSAALQTQLSNREDELGEVNKRLAELHANADGLAASNTDLAAQLQAGETELADLHPAAIAAIVSALRDVGEGQAGRLFAIETAIAHGL